METYIPNTKILYVDDEENLLSSFNSMMRKENLKIFLLHDSTKIDELLEAEGPFAIVLSDQRMPVMDGVAVLERVVQKHPETIRILVTGYSEQTDTLRAINQGRISHYIAKPWDDTEVKKNIREFVTQYNLKYENTFLMNELTKKNADLTELLEGTVAQTVHILSDMLGYVNLHATAQVGRIRKLGSAILDLVPNVSAEERWEILRAFDLCNLGLLVLPPWIQASLNKDGIAILDRFPVAQNHHLLAAGLLKDIPRLGGVAKILQYAKKDFDGTGEPTGDAVRGKDIPLGARILHILFDLEKLTTENFKGREVMIKMLQYPSKYDVELIHHVLGDAAQKRKLGSEMRLLISDLKDGMLTLQDILTVGNQNLLSSNITLTRTSITILQQWHKKDPIREPILVFVNE